MRFGAIAAGGAALLLIGAVGYGYLSDRSDNIGQPVLSPPSGQAFDKSRALAEGPSRGSFSPDGRQVAVLDRAAVGLANGGAVKAFTPAGARIVDFAWMPDSSSVLVAEGPVPTGQVSVIDFAGKVLGTARLAPSIGFGSGYGMSVDSRGARAAVIAVERDPVGGRIRRDLAVIDLVTGEVTQFPTPDRDETQPVFVDDDTVAVMEVFAGSAGEPRGVVAIVDIASKERSELESDGLFSVVGVTDSAEVVIAERRSGGQVVSALAADGSRRTELITLAGDERAVASDPRALRLLIVSDVEVPAAAGGTDIVSRLRAIDVRRPSADEGSSSG